MDNSYRSANNKNPSQFKSNPNFKSEFSRKFTAEEQENFFAWKKRADKGFANAQFQTGLCYEEGKGVERSYPSAFHYYKLATDQNRNRAQFLLATLYKVGQGIEQSYSQVFFIIS